LNKKLSLIIREQPTIAAIKIKTEKTVEGYNIAENIKNIYDDSASNLKCILQV